MPVQSLCARPRETESRAQYRNYLGFLYSAGIPGWRIPALYARRDRYDNLPRAKHPETSRPAAVPLYPTHPPLPPPPLRLIPCSAGQHALLLGSALFLRVLPYHPRGIMPCERVASSWPAVSRVRSFTIVRFGRNSDVSAIFLFNFFRILAWYLVLFPGFRFSRNG